MATLGPADVTSATSGETDKSTPEVRADGKREREREREEGRTEERSRTASSYYAQPDGIING